MAGRASGAKGTGRTRGSQGPTTVTRAGAAGPVQRDPGVQRQAMAKRDVNEHTNAAPGQQATGETVVSSNTVVPSRGRFGSSVPTVPAAGGRQEHASSVTGGPSLFERMGTRNHMLSRRNRPTA